MKLRVRDIQRFSLDDGPGIRSVVFLQGCPLRCWWCHNPAMQSHTGCRVEWDVERLAGNVERDARYWMQSGGGVTVSGGEPLLQAEGVRAFLESLATRGHHRCVETAGYATAETVAELEPWVSLWLFDLKTADANAFKAACGGELERVLSNLRMLLSRRAESVWVRIPVIKGHNDDCNSLDLMARVLADQPHPARIQLLPGHELGTASGRDPAADPESCRTAESIFRRLHDCVEVCW